MRPETVEAAIRETHRILSSTGNRLAPSKVVRLARDYVRAQPPCSFAAYILRNATPHIRSAPLARGGRVAVEWKDPTGEQAVRNVSRRQEDAA